MRTIKIGYNYDPSHDDQEQSYRFWGVIVNDKNETISLAFHYDITDDTTCIELPWDDLKPMTDDEKQDFITKCKAIYNQLKGVKLC